MSSDGAAPGDGWIRNPGYRLGFTEGRKIFVRLRNGIEPADPWAVEQPGGREGCCFELRGHPFDIVAFKLAA